ncbi:GPW/gp25 family protein [Scandinavium sp. H11S7]|uniref:GPW/gp25 family protein n=1 Tax=Scandinavium hiltneri TaxID=2926519 RepID=UPI002164FBCB|nr:GPW/gp25 family protein [Scandinavium hiltneri]MCS2158548.1 GPW/gp25 family protein [Scandinavium hiltneri]
MITLLQRLTDNNPKNMDEQQEAEDQSEVLIADILLLLSSRPRSYHVENIPAINESIINYGVSDVFASDTPRLERNSIMRERIQTALQRFEPRLNQIEVFPGQAQGGISSFIIEADAFFGPVRYHLMWDDVISQFSLRN